MLGIGKAWINDIDYSYYGTAYFSITSIPIEVEKGVYQIKCLCTKEYCQSKYEMKYLQFDTNSTNITLEFLESLKNNYIKAVDFCGYYTDNSNVYIVCKCKKPVNVTITKYNAKRIHSLFLRLSKLKIQEKPILK